MSRVKSSIILWLAIFASLLFSSALLAQKPEAKKNFEMGMNYKLEGSNFQAKEMFQKALEIDPNFYAARVELAGVYADLNMLPEALNELTKLDKVKRTVPKLHSYKGLINYKLGLDEWRELVQNNPKYAYKDDGTVQFIKKGNSPELQIDKLRKKIDRDTTNFEARYQLRGMYYDAAIAELLQAVKDNPKDTLAYLTLGLTYLERGKRDLASKQQNILEKIDLKSASDLKQMIEYADQGKKEMEKEP